MPCHFDMREIKRREMARDVCIQKSAALNEEAVYRPPMKTPLRSWRPARSPAIIIEAAIVRGENESANLLPGQHDFDAGVIISRFIVALTRYI